MNLYGDDEYEPLPRGFYIVAAILVVAMIIAAAAAQ